MVAWTTSSFYRSIGWAPNAGPVSVCRPNRDVFRVHPEPQASGGQVPWVGEAVYHASTSGLT